MSFNCIVLNTNILVPISIFKKDEEEFVDLGQRKCPLKNFTVVLLRNNIYIYEMKDASIDSSAMKLWKTNNAKMSDINKRNISTEDDVKNKLNGEEMELTKLFKKYFENELNRANENDDEFSEKIHVIVTINSATVTTGKCPPTFYLSNKKFVLSHIFFIRSGKRQMEDLNEKLDNKRGRQIGG
jgi:hypothetical protein